MIAFTKEEFKQLCNLLNSIARGNHQWPEDLDKFRNDILGKYTSPLKAPEIKPLGKKT
jgi:hypothetical protein